MTGADFERLIASVETLKEEAKLFRDDGDHQAAIDVLAEAVALIDASGWEKDSKGGQEPSDDQKKVAWQLADCLGMMGGNYRRLSKLDSAMECFLRGKKYEEDARYAVKSSYNLVNAIILPIETHATTAVDQRQILQGAVAVLDRQVNIGDRRLDRWAWADLGQCQLLSGDAQGASKSYDRFVALGDPDSTRSAATVLRRLADALSDRDKETARIVSEGAKDLDEKASG